MSIRFNVTDYGTGVDELRNTLIGRSVVKVRRGSSIRVPGKDWFAEGELVLDDGTLLLLDGNTSCGGCMSGGYDLTDLNEMPINGITNVEVETSDDRDDEYGWAPTTYRVFVLAFGDRRYELASFDGTDGNGYYGTGFWVAVVPPAS